MSYPRQEKIQVVVSSVNRRWGENYGVAVKIPNADWDYNNLHFPSSYYWDKEGARKRAANIKKSFEKIGLMVELVDKTK